MRGRWTVYAHSRLNGHMYPVQSFMFRWYAQWRMGWFEMVNSGKVFDHFIVQRSS